MSQFDVDIPDGAFDGPAEAPEPVEASVPETPAETAAPVEASAPVETAAPAETAEPKVFDADYVRELREEAARYRTRSKPWLEAFDGIDESDQEVFRGLAKMYREDPAAAAKEMARLAQGLLGDVEVPASTAPTAGEKLSPYMTKADFDALREQERIEAATRAIEAQASDLGYAIGTPKYQYLLATAKENGGDLAAAHAAIEADRQAAIQSYVSQKEQEAANSPTAPAEASAPASGQRELKTWRDVDAAIDELF